MTPRLKIGAINLFAASIGWLAKTPGRLRVLTFHDISDDAGDLYAVTKSQFADYLLLLKDEGYTTIRAGDLVADWPSILSRNRLVLLTFDDGYSTQRDIAAELLIQHGLTATCFAISSLLRRNRSRYVFAGKERTLLGVEDLQQMTLGGFEIGSHSHTHAMLGTMPADKVDAEMRLSKRVLQEAIGHEVVSFAYPFGQRGAFSPTTRSVLEKNKYLAAFTQEGTRITPKSNLLHLPRTNVDRFDTLATFRRKLLGHYDSIGVARRYRDYVRTGNREKCVRFTMKLPGNYDFLRCSRGGRKMAS